jgi:acyl carrier protein
MTESEFFVSFSRGLEELFLLPPGSLDRSRSLDSLRQWTSLGNVEFIAFADETYGVNVSGEQLRNCRTVGDLAKLIPPQHQAELGKYGR